MQTDRRMAAMAPVRDEIGVELSTWCVNSLNDHDPFFQMRLIIIPLMSKLQNDILTSCQF